MRGCWQFRLTPLLLLVKILPNSLTVHPALVSEHPKHDGRIVDGLHLLHANQIDQAIDVFDLAFRDRRGGLGYENLTDVTPEEFLTAAWQRWERMTWVDKFGK